jgi:hypothetical protein
MKYKVGDKVRIRTWNDMEKEFGSKRIDINSARTYISCPGKLDFTYPMEKLINRDFHTRVLTIKSMDEYTRYGDFEDTQEPCYIMDEMGVGYKFTDVMIQCLAEERMLVSPKKRWQILDLRG